MSYPRDGLRFVALILPLAWLFGCASNSPETHRAFPLGHAVVGSGSDDDQAVLKNSNQQIFDAEHAQTPDSSTNSDVQGSSLP